MKKQGFWIYWYNPSVSKTGIVEYTTTSTERAVKLFYRDYSEDYEIVCVRH